MYQTPKTPIRKWDDAMDARTLQELTADDCNIPQKLPICLAVFHHGTITHWSFAWKAYGRGTTTITEATRPVGYKTIEVRNPGANPNEFEYRFSFKPGTAYTVNVSSLF